MKKSLSFIMIFMVFTFAFSITANAQNNTNYDNNELFDFDTLKEILDENTKDFLEENGVDINDYTSINNLKTENVFMHIFSLFKSGFSKVIKMFSTLIGIVLISATVSSFENENIKNISLVISTICFSLIIADDVWKCVFVSVDTVRNIGDFMLSFIPVLTTVTLLSGGAVSSVVSSSLLIFIAQCISFIFSYFVIPFMGVYIGITFVSTVSPLDTINEISGSVKKVCVWILSLLSTVFIGILGIQTTINSQADSLGIKTAKFIIGTAIPIAGSSLAEATNTVYSSMSLIKSAIGIYGIIAISVMILPIIVEILVWKVVFFVTDFVSKLLSLNKISLFTQSLSGAFSVFLTIILFSVGIFIISLGVVLTAGKIQ